MSNKRLYKSTVNCMLCGVCGGIAEYFDIDPTLVRLAWVISVSYTHLSLYPPLRNQPDRQPAWAASEIQRRMVRSCLPEFVFFFKIRRIARKNIWHLPDVFRFHAESFARRQKRIFKCHGACRWIHGRDGRIYYKKRRRTPVSYTHLDVYKRQV